MRKNLQFIMMTEWIRKGEELEHNLVKRKLRCYNRLIRAHL